MEVDGVRINCGRFEALALAIASQIRQDSGAKSPRPGHPADVLVTLVVPPHHIEEALTPEVRWVHVLGAGVDGFPSELLADRTLTCSRGASAGSIAEWVVASMLAFEKQFPDSWVSAPPLAWHTASLGGLRGKTLGLVGVGAIGSEVARLVGPFGMEILATRRSAAASAPRGVTIVSDLLKLAAAADHLILAAPATPETENLIDAQVLAAMKPGAHLVNVARGSLIDHDALRSALDIGPIVQATLDVVDPEPLPAGHWLYEHPGVRLSPHVSWSAPDTMTRTIDLFIENLTAWRSGQALKGRVKIASGY